MVQLRIKSSPVKNVGTVQSISASVLAIWSKID